MEETEFKAGFEAGLSQSEVRSGHLGADFILLPNECRLKSLESLLQAPLRKKGTVVIHDEDSLIRYVNLHKEAGSRIFASVRQVAIKAVFDHHTAEGAGWAEHGALYSCPLSRPWRTWMECDRKMMPQRQFAEFLEDNLPDIVDPDGSKLLDVCSHLEARKKVSYASAQRLHDGQVQFQYQEELEQAGSAKGAFKIPQQITVGLSPFERGTLYRITARLRWRISDDDKQLSFSYILDQPDVILETAFTEITERIHTATELEPFFAQV